MILILEFILVRLRTCHHIRLKCIPHSLPLGASYQGQVYVRRKKFTKVLIPLPFVVSKKYEITYNSIILITNRHTRSGQSPLSLYTNNLNHKKELKIYVLGLRSSLLFVSLTQRSLAYNLLPLRVWGFARNWKSHCLKYTCLFHLPEKGGI